MSVCASAAQIDTLKLSTAFTTHLILNTDIVYADISNSKAIVGKVIEQNRNMMAMKAREAFTEPTSLSVLDSGGKMLTFIVVYDPSPSVLVVDTRKIEEPQPKEEATRTRGKDRSGNVSQWKAGDSPSLSEVIKLERNIFHVGKKEYDIEVACENIWYHNDVTYIELSVKNGSGISYEIKDATFVIESKRVSKRTVNYDSPVSHKNSYGSLTAAPEKTANIVYSFSKMTLSKAQVLKVYFYEINGQRNLVMTIDARDINKAMSLMK